MFTDGFEKEAGLKHLALAGMMAASPAKAHGKSGDMLKTVGNAARQTQVGKSVASKANEYLKRAQNVKLIGRGGEAAAEGGKASANSARKAGPNLSIRDGNRLSYNHGSFEASLSHRGDAKAKYNISKNWGAEAEASGGGERRAGVFFKKDF